LSQRVLEELDAVAADAPDEFVLVRRSLRAALNLVMGRPDTTARPIGEIVESVIATAAEENVEVASGVVVTPEEPVAGGDTVALVLKQLATNACKHDDARDITLQKQIQRELREAKEAAELANRTKDQFLSVLSHELRTPLTPVLAEMSYLEEVADLPESIRGNIAMIRRNVETEARLVDDLLDVTRISRGKLRLQFEVVDVNEAIRAVVAMVQGQIDQKAIELTVGLRARKHHVWADPGRLQQVFLNLLSNAVKFTPEGGRIEVRAGLANGTAVISVTATGVGIAPEDHDAVFEEFRQVGTADKKAEGTGLGLALCRKFVELHGGRIWVESQVGDGSRFYFTLPVAQ